MKPCLDTQEKRKNDTTEKESPSQKWKRISQRVVKQNKLIHILTVDNDSPEQDNLQSSQRISFNVNAFKAHIQFGRLSQRAKQLFSKDPELRTENNIDELYRVVDKLQCFSKYSRAEKPGLAKFVYYSQYETGRIIVKQGDPAHSFYFILKGSVNIVAEDIDIITGNVTQDVIGEILAGDSFGELALLHNTRRRASIICKEDTEFLRLDKVDFNQVLRDTYQREWDERMNHLKEIPAFQDWPLKELGAANTASKLVEYPDRTLLLKDEIEPPEFVYSIKSGTCVLVKEIKLLKRKMPFGREELYLPRERNEIDPPCLNRAKKNETLLRYLLVIRTFRSGDYFGAGENMKDSFIITKGKTMLMLIPRSILITFHRGKVLELMKKELWDREWTREEIFQVFLQNRKWEDYKIQVTRDIYMKKPTLKRTSLKDVPDYIKAENSSRYYNV